MIALTFLGSVLAGPSGASAHSAAFERFLDATTAARHTPMCFTPLVEELHASRSEMSLAERREVDSFLGPAATSLPLRTRGPRFVEATAPPSTGSERTTCVPIAEDYGANQLVGARFTIAWDEGATESQAEQLMEAFDESYEREIGELGWAEPTGMDAFNLWVYIADDDWNAGAFTSLDSCPSRGYMPFIVVYSGALSAGNWYQDCAAHELNHASQWGYGSLWEPYDLWWWEATATWMEEHVYPSHNGWSQYTLGFAQWPEIGMHASSQESQSVFWHMYGMSVWAFYLDEYAGGRDFVRGTWEYLDTHSAGTMPEVLPGMGVDFDETYEGFLAASAVMDFEEHDWFYPVTLTQDMTELPHTGTPNGSLPQGLGLNFFKIDRSTNPDGKDVQVTFTSEEDVDWYVVLATTSDSSTVKEYAAATKDEKTGDWVAQLPWDAEGDAYMTVSPKSTELDRDYEYKYTVALVDPPPPVDTGEPGSDTSKHDDPSDEDKGSCASVGGPASLLLAALSLLATRRRRLTSRV